MLRFHIQKEVNGIPVDLLLAFMILRRTDLPVISQDLGPFPVAGGNVSAASRAGRCRCLTVAPAVA